MNEGSRGWTWAFSLAELYSGEFGAVLDATETEELPPPATCYGFLLSLIGERDRRRHVGVRICPALLAVMLLAGMPRFV